MPTLTFSLHVEGQPASPDVLGALQQMEVEDHADLADMLRIRLGTAAEASGESWHVLDDDVFRRLANVRVAVRTDGGESVPLIDAYVVDLRTEISEGPGRSIVEVVAMDATVLMNLEEKVRAWPDMSDSSIASAIFGEYGFTPDVEDTRRVRQQTDVTTMQRGTDIAFLQRLAQRNGFECFVEAGPTGSTGHFHRPRLEEEPQGVLSVNLGTATNVRDFTARHDMLRAATAVAPSLDVASASDQSAQAADAELRELGGTPAIPSDRPRRVLLSQTGLHEASDLQTAAQATVDRSSWAIEARGVSSVAAYGGIIRAKRSIMVRGAGAVFSGPYYVSSVLHTVSAGGHLQQFTLRRNAQGVRASDDFREDDAATPQPAVSIP